MARLNAAQWEQARAEYEVRGISLGEVAKQFGVDRAAVSRHAKKHGWEQGKSHGVAEKKVTAIKALAEAQAESHALPVTFQRTVDIVVREQLEAEGILAQFGAELSRKGIALARAAESPESLESLSRTHKNLSPREAKPQTTVNVSQQQAVMPPLSPRDALAAIVHQAQAMDAEAVNV